MTVDAPGSPSRHRSARIPDVALIHVRIKADDLRDGSGVTGDDELEGQEEAISSYNETVAVDQLRHAIRLTGALDEQENAYDMRTDAKNKLRDWLVGIKERMIFLKLAGVTNTTLTNVSGE